MDRGWVKLYRKTLGNGILQSPHALQVFIYCLLKASRGDRSVMIGGTIIEVHSGEVVTSRHNLCADLSLSDREVRTALEILKKLKIATISTTNKCTKISIMNWASYQDCDQLPDQQIGQQTTSTRPAPDQTTRIRELKNININLNSASDDAPRTEVQPLRGKRKTLTGKRAESFERFWNAFAYKKGRAQAIDAWAEIPTLTDSLVERIIKAAEAEATRRPELVAKGRTPIYPQGWITGRRWEDEEVEAPTTEAQAVEEYRPLAPVPESYRADRIYDDKMPDWGKPKSSGEYVCRALARRGMC